MNIHRIWAAPAAVALAFAAASSFAQDKPNSGTAAKPKAGATSATKAPATQAPVQLNGVNSKATPEPTGTKQMTPAAARSVPGSKRDGESCHSKESDA